jgi:hypothetical protein
VTLNGTRGGLVCVLAMEWNVGAGDGARHGSGYVNQ